MTQANDHDIKIQLNGDTHTLAPCSLAELVVALDLQGQRIAIEHNEAIVPRSQHAETLLLEGDCVEIIHAVGGG